MNAAKVKKHLSIKLLKVVFSIYFLVAIVITLFHIYISFDEAKNQINNELIALEDSFKPALTTAIWELNDEQLKTIANGILDIDYVTAIIIVDPKGKELFQSGDFTDDSDHLHFFHQFTILKHSFENTFQLADVKIYSSSKMVVERIFIGVIVLIINAIIKTLVLWFLLLWAFRKYIFQPLNKFVDGLDSININVSEQYKIDLEIKDENELKLMETSFNRMSETISLQKKELLEHEQNLIDIEKAHSLNLQKEVDRQTQELLSVNEKLTVLVSTDELTKINNRRSFFEISNKLFSIAKRDGENVAILMCDLDHFKQVNDTYGHAVGDQVLCHFTNVANKILRDSDLFARLGGEEFVVLLRNTDLVGARDLAERIRYEIEINPLQVSNEKISITVSIGITVNTAEESNIELLLSKADKALYSAKNTGRNKIISA